MNEHYHTSLEHILVYGVSAILVIHGIRIGASWLVKSNNPTMNTAGKALGGLVHFG